MRAATRTASNFGPTTPIVAKLRAITRYLKNEITFGGRAPKSYLVRLSLDEIHWQWLRNTLRLQRLSALQVPMESDEKDPG